MENVPLRGIFALGPAPPGHKPPNTALFARLETHLLTMYRHLRDATVRLDRLRSAMRMETSHSMRLAIREETMKTIKDQVRTRELIAKYRLKLQTLQEAEILKVVKHMHEMGKNAQHMNSELALLNAAMKRETDPDNLRWHEQKIYNLLKEQQNAKDLRERWRVRLVQMETAKIKVVTPAATLRRQSVNMKILPPKPKTDKESISNVVADNTTTKMIPTLKAKTDTEGTNKVVAENKRKQIHTPRTDTDGTNKVVADIRKQVPTPLPKTDAASINIPLVKNIKKVPTPKPKTDAESINIPLVKNIKKISPAKLQIDTKCTSKVETENKRMKISPPKAKTDTQMETAKGKSVTPAPILQRESVKTKIPPPKPKMDKESLANLESVIDSVAKNEKTSISPSKPTTDPECLFKVVTLKTKEKIDKRKKDYKGCKRCAFLQRANKNKKYGPKICKVCLKWAHKVLQNGIDKGPKKSEAHIPAVSESATKQEIMPGLNTDLESTIKVEIEPMHEFSMTSEKVTLLDTTKSSINEEIQPLEASMNDELVSDLAKEDNEMMSDVIKEKNEIISDLIKEDNELMSVVIKEEKEETDNLTKTEILDFDRVSSIQDELKAIEDKNTALAHVRILQEYAMLKDNYRVIGLLSEVENALINPPKNEDFEY